VPPERVGPMQGHRRRGRAWGGQGAVAAVTTAQGGSTADLVGMPTVGAVDLGFYGGGGGGGHGGSGSHRHVHRLQLLVGGGVVGGAAGVAVGVAQAVARVKVAAVVGPAGVHHAVGDGGGSRDGHRGGQGGVICVCVFV